MKNCFKKLLVGIVVVALALAPLSMSVPAATKTTKNTATVSIERFTIGQGYIVEPTQVEFESGDTVAALINKVAKSKNVKLIIDTSYSWYIQGIEHGDTRKLDIPKAISAMEDYDTGYEIIKAPSNANNTGDGDNDTLEARDYCSMSGFFFSLNNKNPGVGADQVVAKDGDVIRVQFSLYGYGADLGIADPAWCSIKQLSLANKDVLSKKYAECYAKGYDKDKTVKAACDTALAVLTKFDSSQKEVNTAYANLKELIDIPTLAKPTLKVTNVKTRKAKLLVKKSIANANGYQFKYANNKKFKSSKVKNTTKKYIKTKKFKKKQRCYAKVRAYVKRMGNKYYSKWSKTKSKKIKK